MTPPDEHGWRTLLSCQHPFRNTYRKDHAVCQVCPTCRAVRSTDEGRWQSEQRWLYEDGLMTTPDGRVIHDNWRHPSVTILRAAA